MSVLWDETPCNLVEIYELLEKQFAAMFRVEEVVI
jgi:hypothetical protein